MRHILKYFGLEPAEVADADRDTIRRIADELERLDPDRARYIAAFAYVLSRVARADQEVTQEETAAMERLVTEHGLLPSEQAVMVVQMAKTQHLLFGGTDDYTVTREFARLATKEQKLALIDCLFAVSASDESILTIEDNEIVRVAHELKIERADVVRIRANYRDRLEVGKLWRSEK
jgi:uncharacterized tellurite resistance protein B-like protein